MTETPPTYPQSDHAAGRCSCGRRPGPAEPAEPDAPDQHAARLTPEEIARHDETGWDTDGCDCGHDGMGPGWHASDCTWRGAYEYGRAVNVPLSPEAAEYIGRRIAGRTAPRRKIKLPDDTITNQQWTDAVSAVGRAVKAAKTAGPDDYQLAPSPVDESANVDSRLADCEEIRREQYAAAISEVCDGIVADLIQGDRLGIADAAMAVADAEMDGIQNWISLARQVERDDKEDVARLAGERSRARRTAVELENQLAAVRDYLRFSLDDGPRTRETVLRILASDGVEDTP